jgi:hypothetical protein
MTITGDDVPHRSPLDLGPASGLADGWPDVNGAERADHRVLVAIVLAGVATDLTIRSGVMGLAGALLPVVVVAGVLGSGRVTNRRAWPLLLAAPLFGLWFAVRADPVLQVLDLAAAAGLLLVGASLGRGGDPRDLTLPNLFGRALHAFVHAVLAPGFVLGGLRAGRAADPTNVAIGDPHSTPTATTTASSLAFVRGALLAAPVVLVVGLLLGSADPVFASFFGLPDDTGDVILHLVLLTIGAWGAATLLRLVSVEPFGLPSNADGSTGLRPIGDVEAATVLGGLVLVFAAFSVSQLVAVIGGADYVLRTAGLSYGEYARHGFFQLLTVATLTLAVLLALRATVKDPSSRTFLVLSELAVALTLLLVAGAVRRLWLYEQAYGLTPLRLWSLLFALWIGVVFVLLAVSLPGRVASHRSWFVPAAIAAGLVGLLVVDVANPDAWIVRRNVDRFAATGKLDVDVLLDLPDDAVPALFDALPRLTEDERTRVLLSACSDPRHAEGGLWAFNGATDAAIEARNRHCPETTAGR